MVDLTPCEACERHVRADEARCPFCAAPFHAPAEVAARPSRSRAGRVAVVAFGVSLAMGTSSCVALYGAPVPDHAGQAEDGSAEE